MRGIGEMVREWGREGKEGKEGKKAMGVNLKSISIRRLRPRGGGWPRHIATLENCDGRRKTAHPT